MTTLEVEWGSYVHGLFVTFSSTPSTDGSGTTEMSFAFQQHLRAKLHIFGNDASAGSAMNDLYADQNNRFINYNSVADSTELTASPYTFQYYLAWENPDTSSSLAYDGIQARVIATVTSGVTGSETTTPATISAIWEDTGVSGEKFDIRPTT